MNVIRIGFDTIDKGSTQSNKLLALFSVLLKITRLIVFKFALRQKKENNWLGIAWNAIRSGKCSPLEFGAIKRRGKTMIEIIDGANCTKIVITIDGNCQV